MMGQPDLGGSWSTELASSQPQDQGTTSEELITRGEGVSTISVTSDVEEGPHRRGDFIAIKSTIPPIAEESDERGSVDDVASLKDSLYEQVELREINKQSDIGNGSAFGATSHEPNGFPVGGLSSAVFLTKDGAAVPNGNLPIMPSDQTDMAPEMTTSSAEEIPGNGNLPLTTETILGTESITTTEDKSSKFKRKKVSWNEKVYVNRLSGEGTEDVIVEGLQEEDHEYSPFEDDEVFPPNAPPSPTKTTANGTVPKIRSNLEHREKIQTYVSDNKIWVRKCCICVLAVLLLIVILALIALAAIFVWKFVPQDWSKETENIRKRLELSEVSSNMTFNPFTKAWSSTPDDRVRYFLIEEKDQMMWRKPDKPAVMTWLSGEPLQITGWNPNAVSPYNDFLAGDPIKVAQSLYHVFLDTDRWYTIKIAQEQKYCLLSILPRDDGESVTWTKLIENSQNEE